jgi:DNA-binding NarL/FixJ family response regulator
VLSSEKIRVAIVEDQYEFRLHIEEVILHSHECSLIWSASTGYEAINQIRVSDFDILLCDLGLPDMSGIQVVQEAHKIRPHSNIMIITLFGDDDTVIKSMQSGAKGYILKNDLPTNFINDIKALHRGDSPLSPKIARAILKKLNLINNVHNHHPLTPKEYQVLQMIASGKSLKSVANELGNATSTISGYTKSIYKKLGVNSMTQATYYARQQGWVK